MSYWRCKSQMTAREVAQHERILDNRLAHPQRGRYEKKAIYADAEEGDGGDVQLGEVDNREARVARAA